MQAHFACRRDEAAVRSAIRMLLHGIRLLLSCCSLLYAHRVRRQFDVPHLMRWLLCSSLRQQRQNFGVQQREAVASACRGAARLRIFGGPNENPGGGRLPTLIGGEGAGDAAGVGRGAASEDEAGP